MRNWRRWLARCLGLVSRRRGDARVREEIDAHLAMLAEEHERAGLAPDEARRRARLDFGSEDATREACRDQESLPLVEDLIQDLRFAFRMLRKSPGFSALVVITLMLAIGANVVVFGVLNAVILRPLDVRDPAGLYQVRLDTWTLGRLLTTSYPAFEAYRRRNTTFSGMVAFNAYSHAALVRPGQAVREVHGSEVSGGYFDLLGVTPELGSFFHAGDVHGPNSAPYVVLSYGLWRSAFDADPGAIGSVVELNRHPFTVVGVAPPRFHGTEQFAWPDYWIPIANQEQVNGWDYLHDRSHHVTVVGRLKPGVTPVQAVGDLSAISAELARAYPKTDSAVSIRLVHPGLYGDDGDLIRAFLYGVTALGLLVQVAACTNLASLFVARAADRQRELALRMALGSNRGRLMRQLLTEASIVASLGGAAGLCGAAFLLAALNRWRPAFGHIAVAVDGRVVLVGLALTLGSALVLGLIPARQVWRSSPLTLIKGGVAEARRRRWLNLGDLLLGAQITICTVLVTASLVAFSGMRRTLRTPLGFELSGVVLAGVNLGEIGMHDRAAAEKERAMLDAARGVSGVTAVGAVSSAPLDGWMRGILVYREGATDLTPAGAVLSTYVYLVSPGYFVAAGTRLTRGRDVTWSDGSNAPQVAVVNETFARRVWGEASPLGRTVTIWGRRTEVVGVAQNGKYHDLAETPQPAVYLPMTQHETDNVTLVVRSDRASNETEVALRRALGAVEPDVPLVLRSWPAALAGVRFPAQAAAAALGSLGGLAAMLAVTGIFGMAAYDVSRRRREFGIRAALGARRGQVIASAVGRPLALLGVGAIIGLLAGLYLGRLLRHIVYQADPASVGILFGSVLAMILVGVVGAALPARQAAAVEPAALMKED